MTATVLSFPQIKQRKDATWLKAGLIHNQLSNWRETKEWKAIAAKHEAARIRANELLLKGGLGTAAYTEARAAYHLECQAVLSYDKPKPRNLPSMIRCAADLLEEADPAWNHWADQEQFVRNGKAAGILALVYSRAIIAARV